MGLKEKLMSLMKENKIKNLYDLARQCNIPYTTLRNITSDDKENQSSLRVDTAMKLCDFFKISLDELLSNQIDLSEVEFASNNGIENADCLTIDEVKEVNDFIKWTIAKREMNKANSKKKEN